MNRLNFEVLKGQHVLLVSSCFKEQSILPLIVDKINSIQPKSLQVAVLVSENNEISKLSSVNTYIGYTHPTKELIGYGFGR